MHVCPCVCAPLSACVCVCMCVRVWNFMLWFCQTLNSFQTWLTCLSISCLAIRLKLMHLILTFLWLWYMFLLILWRAIQTDLILPRVRAELFRVAHLVVGPEWLDTCTGRSMLMPSRSRPIRIMHNLSTTRLKTMFFCNSSPCYAGPWGCQGPHRLSIRMWLIRMALWKWRCGSQPGIRKGGPDGACPDVSTLCVTLDMSVWHDIQQLIHCSTRGIFNNKQAIITPITSLPFTWWSVTD